MRTNTIFPSLSVAICALLTLFWLLILLIKIFIVFLLCIEFSVWGILFSSCLQTYNMLYCVPKSVHHCSNYAEATTTRLKCHSERKRGNPLNRNANLNGVLPRASLVLAISTAQKIFAISSSRDKNSCHNFARLSAWCWRASTQADKRTLIQSVLIHGMCNFKDGTRAARRRGSERRA